MKFEIPSPLRRRPSFGKGYTPFQRVEKQREFRPGESPPYRRSLRSRLRSTKPAPGNRHPSDWKECLELSARKLWKPSATCSMTRPLNGSLMS